MDVEKKKERPTKLYPQYVNRAVQLPYDIQVSELETAVSDTYRLFSGINDFLEGAGFRPLEELLLGNSLSGIISEMVVKNIARSSKTLMANTKVGGHPDLLPKEHFGSNNAVLKGAHGIEVKCSIQRGGWQGHNPEACWILIFRYAIGKQDNGEILPLTFVEIMCAKLNKSDWSFSGRKGKSRRTPTASITTVGVEKLRRNFIYRIPDVGIGRHADILAKS